MRNEQRIAFSKQWAALKNFDKDEIAELRGQNQRLISAIKKTLQENGHLADGDNCTLIVLKMY